MSEAEQRTVLTEKAREDVTHARMIALERALERPGGREATSSTTS